jgi:hypothetical protein
MTGATKTYVGRVEYLAVQAEVESKLAAGHRTSPIYRELAEAGRMTIRYSIFCAYIRGQGERRPGPKKLRLLKQAQRPVPKSALRPSSDSPKRQDFSHERMADLEESGPPAKVR